MSMGWFRTLAQAIRHAPLLRRLSPLWTLVRPLYIRILRIVGRKGITVRIGGQTFRIHPDYARISFESFEPLSYSLLPTHLRPGDAFIDVGTAIGSYTLVAGRLVGPSGLVVSYEADPAARRYLEKHLNWNGQADRTVIRPVCCGRTNGEISFYISPTDIGGQASIFPQSGFLQISVPCVTLDTDLRTSRITPRFIKIDVEGAEWDVLQGSENILREYMPLLLISLHPTKLALQGVTESMILDWLSARGYEAKVVERDYEVHVFAQPRSKIN